MYIEKISITGYKSYENETIEFKKGLNVIIGENNSGKTALIESIRLACPIYVFRSIWQRSYKNTIFDITKYITPFVGNNKSNTNYFEIGVKIRMEAGDSDFWRNLEDFTNVFNDNCVFYYKLRYYTIEQYNYCCFLKELETPYIKIETTIDENATPPFLNFPNFKLKRKVNGAKKELIYSEYISEFDKPNNSKFPELFYLQQIQLLFDAYIPPEGLCYFTSSDERAEQRFLDNIISARGHEKILETHQNDAFGLYRKSLREKFDKELAELTSSNDGYIYNNGHDWEEERNTYIPDNDVPDKDTPDAIAPEFKRLNFFVRTKGIRGYGIEFDNIGSGIKRYLTILWKSLISSVNHDENGNKHYSPLLILDEIDLNMHPKLIRRLALFLHDTLKNQRKSQIILTTHSSALLDFALENEYNILQLKYTNQKTEIIPKDKLTFKTLLDDLGIKASHLLQSNGLIFVEGPSDIIYIEHFLALFAEEKKRDRFLKGIHYDYCMYGGKVLKRYEYNPSLESNEMTNALINVKSINRNIFFVFDRDNFSLKPSDGAEINKKKIIDAINDEQLWWMTKGRFIEHYLSDSDLKKHLNKKGLIKKDTDKVDIAKKYVNEKPKFSYWFRNDNQLLIDIEKLWKSIESWNSNE